jgi:hypothetical protein
MVLSYIVVKFNEDIQKFGFDVYKLDYKDLKEKVSFAFKKPKNTFNLYSQYDSKIKDNKQLMRTLSTSSDPTLLIMKEKDNMFEINDIVIEEIMKSPLFKQKIQEILLKDKKFIRKLSKKIETRNTKIKNNIIVEKKKIDSPKTEIDINVTTIEMNPKETNNQEVNQSKGITFYY